jgi:protein-S-isoprenylcysteine O-methyltransferase Ste14
MSVDQTRIAQATVVIVMLGWIMFAATFLGRKRPSASRERKRTSASFAAIMVQGLGYAVAWTLRRPLFTPILPVSMVIAILLSLLVAGLVVGAIAMISSAVRTLGKQWSFAARVVEDHKLITGGPYRLVRHPIYSGMLMMLVATGLAISHWAGLVAAVVVFSIGTALRVRIEERLLTETFGSAYADYMQRVPALIPWKGRGRG